MTRHAIVLAAGAGRRFGGRKLLAIWHGEPLILATVKLALGEIVSDVTVVLGSDSDEIGAALAPVAGLRVRTVVANDWTSGISASLRAGLLALPGSATSVCVLLADMPLVPTGMINALLDRVEAGAPAARPVHSDGPAHPVAFSAALMSALLRLQGDQGARDLLTSLGDQVALLPTDNPGVVFDVDRPLDLEPRPNICE